MISHALLALFVQTVSSAGPFQSWEISSSTLSTTRYHAFVAYNEESVYSDCIFIFGGIGCTTCMQCYNITDNSIFTYDTLTKGGYSQVQSSAVMIVDKDLGTELIYFLTYQGYIQKYNVLTKTETTKYYNSGALEACLLKNKNDSELYIVDGAGGSSFWIYDLIDSELVTGPSLTYTRNDAACTTSYWNEDEPYLYVLGGHNGYIERIKINGLLNDIENNHDLYKWEILWLQLTSNIDDRCTFAYQSTSQHMAVVTYQNYIYLIGGYDGGWEADITYLDVENWEFKYVGEYVAARYGIRCQYAALTQRMYCFGGSTTNQIAFTNIAISTPSSSSCSSISTTTSASDVIMPSQAPTNPTTKPTNMPTVATVAPSESPTNNFTTSAHPTVQPTLKPSDKPTNHPIPTPDPTVPPAYTFIDVVSTLIPTQSPIISIISTNDNDEDSGLTSNSESSVTTADLDSLMNEPLIITIIVLICLILVCCCCVGCCSISYLLYNKCLNKNNDNNNNSDNKNNDHNNNNNNNNNGGKLEIEMKRIEVALNDRYDIDANNCNVDINDVDNDDDDDDSSLLENDQSIGNKTDKNEKIEGEQM